ncbi:MAG TPA: histidine kinase dimerization/phosphoacceptor domain-containing protein [Bryobacteraceae bacterium]|nr:histidine kinase dimerization/phosphoacceptor domain-containing protein [Bryobacteraceae bacterium]
MPLAVPVCQWSFDRERQFHYIGGASAALFGRVPEELVRSSVSIIDDPNGSWAARLDRLFSGNTALEEWTVPVSDGRYIIVHVPVRADGAVHYTAGFAYPDGHEIPAAPELELAARAALQALETERERTARFLHDVVAQCLSSTGLQLELLRIELEAGNHGVRGHTTEIQRRLDEALKQVRAFSTEPDLHLGG